MAPGQPADSGQSADSHVQALEEENRRLREVASARRGAEPSKCGYLFKYRPFKIGMFSNAWELRFFSLAGDVLQYWKSERDAGHHPRGLINVARCVVEWEGRKRDRFWVFSVVDAGGLSLLRMSTEAQADAEGWVQALVHAGCRRRQVNESHRRKSPLRGADVRWKADKGRGAPQPAAGALLTQRWESREAPLVAAIERSDSRADSSAADKDSLGRPRVRDYTSDSNVSEAGGPPPQRGARLAAVAKPRPRGEMRASTDLYTESRPSMLSADRIAVTQHSGLLNLMTLVLLATNARLILENLLKYGVLINPARWLGILVPTSNVPLFLCWPVLLCCCLLALGIERLGAARLEAERRAGRAKRKKDASPADARRAAARLARRNEAALAALSLANTSAVLGVPCAAVHATRADPVPAFLLVLLAVVLWMKLVSYAHCNLDLRRLHRQQEQQPAPVRGSALPEGEAVADGGDPARFMPPSRARQAAGDAAVEYPANLSLNNLAYFLAIPTLVYQPSYPVSSRLRPRRVLLYVARLLVVLGTLVIITEQYMQPTIANSLAPLAQLEWARLGERVLKLSIPTLYGWILIFYALFHVWLNIVAEVTRFGDREFYKDWWNATTIGDYWRLWNVPVHKWLLRHVYFPALRLGLPRTLAACAVFFVSAVFHEVLIGVPLHMVRFWAFGGLMFQVPLLYLTEYVKRKARSDQIGNFVFWFTFVIFGQPMAIMLYYHDWVLLNRPEWVAALKAGRRA